MEDLSVMVIGGGAREHVISRAYEKSRRVRKVIVSPGNDFIGFNREKEVIVDKDCKLSEEESIVKVVEKYHPDLVDIAQDNALSTGAADLLRRKGFRVFGPSKNAAQIEWDKVWSREFMRRHKISCPDFRSFENDEPAFQMVNALYQAAPGVLLFVKAAGLCSGKGALSCRNVEEAIENIRKMASFGDAGKRFLIEQGLKGEEFSYYAISDGTNFYCFKSAQDNKRALNFDQGEQTGGMGAVSPARVTADLKERIEEEQIARAINGMRQEGRPFMGVLYLGGIINNEGIFNIEYNARWGDPECQAVLPGVQTDYADIANACIDRKLGELEIKEDKEVRACVVGASRGYPEDYGAVKGKRIFGLEDAMNVEGVEVYGAGIKIRAERVYADGGRLFSIIGKGRDVIEARAKAYEAISRISIEGNCLHYRTDVGWRDVERERNG
jgi:phosphoribosylamine--glycine ligase